MIRITKLTDYGILVLTLMADDRTGEPRNARELAAATHLPQPTVGKVLRTLAGAGLLASQRGVNGGYRLARAPEDISVAEIITAFEGPIAITDCLSHEGPDCGVESFCPTRTNWDRINRAIRAALEDIQLAQMARPQRGWRRRMSETLATPAGSQGSRSR